MIYMVIGKEAISFPYSAELWLYELSVKLYGIVSFHLIAPPETDDVLLVKEF